WVRAALPASGASPPRLNPPPLRIGSSSLWLPRTASCPNCARRSGTAPAGAAGGKPAVCDKKGPCRRGGRGIFVLSRGHPGAARKAERRRSLRRPARLREFLIQGSGLRLAGMLADGEHLHLHSPL